MSKQTLWLEKIIHFPVTQFVLSVRRILWFSLELNDETLLLMEQLSCGFWTLFSSVVYFVLRFFPLLLSSLCARSFYTHRKESFTVLMCWWRQPPPKIVENIHAHTGSLRYSCQAQCQHFSRAKSKRDLFNKTSLSQRSKVSSRLSHSTPSQEKTDIFRPLSTL